MAFFAIFSCYLCKSRKRERKVKTFKHSYEKKRLFISTDIRKTPVLGSLRHPIYKAGSTNSFSFEDTFPIVSLSAKT